MQGQNISEVPFELPKRFQKILKIRRLKFEHIIKHWYGNKNSNVIAKKAC